MRKLIKGDEVVVIAGKDKGKRGKIPSVIFDAKKGDKF
jgi:large subunit ribosomal protein L24